MKNLRVALAVLILLVPLAIAVGIVRAQAPGVTDDSIVIGLIGPMTGPASYTGTGLRDGAMLYFDEVNAAGGINGRKLRILVEDDACSPVQARAALTKLIERDNVFALAGGVCSNAMFANIPLLAKARIPYVASLVSHPDLLGPDKPFIFRVNTPPTDAQGRILANYAVKKLGARRISVLNDSTEYGKVVASHVVEQLKKLGVTPLTHDPFNLGDTDFTSQLVKIKQAAPEIVINVTWQKEYAIQMRQARELGIQTTWLCAAPSSDMATTKLTGEPGAGTLHHYIYGPNFVDSGEPHLVRFRQAFDRKYPGHPPTRPDEVNMAGYGAATVFAEGLKRAGRQLTREGFVQALESLRGFETGFIFPITFTRDDHQGMKGGKIFKVLPGGKMEFLEHDLSPYWQ